MTDNMFDKFVRDKLGDHQSPVPQGLWEKIERKKDKDPNGGFLLPGAALWLGLLFIATSVAVGYFVFRDGKSTTGHDQVSATAAAKNNGSASTKNTTVSTNEQAITGENTNSNTEKKTRNTISGNHDAQTQDNNDNNIRTATGNNKDNKATVSTAAGYNETGDDSHSVITKETRGNKPYVKLNGKKRRISIAKEGSANIFNGSTEDKTTGKTTTGDPYTATTIGQHLLLSRQPVAYNLRNLSMGSREQFDLSKLRIFGIDCPTTGTPRRNDWYVEVYGSPDITMKSVTAKSNAAYVKKKDSTETQQGGYTAGVRISKSITDNLLVKAGFQYSQINERFDLRTENERRIITVVTIRTISTPSGADSTVRDTSTVEQIGYRLQRTYNRYRSIDIPLLLSYEFGNDNLKFAVNAGVILNLHTWYNGEALNDSLNVVSLSSKSAPIYKQNIGLGLYAGFSIIKSISGKFDVFLEPYFRYNLSNMATGSAYTQKFNAAGLSLGIRYQLKGQRRGNK